MSSSSTPAPKQKCKHALLARLCSGRGRRFRQMGSCARASQSRHGRWLDYSSRVGVVLLLGLLSIECLPRLSDTLSAAPRGNQSGSRTSDRAEDQNTNKQDGSRLILATPQIPIDAYSQTSVQYIVCIANSCSPDIGVGIRAALAMLHGCGTVYYPGGTYTLLTTVRLAPCQEIVGEAASSGVAQADRCSLTGSTVIYSGSGVPFVIAGAGESPYVKTAIENLQICGPGATNTAVFIGGDPNGEISGPGNFAPGVELRDVNIHGFAHAVQFGNNTWGDSFEGFTASGSTGDEIYWTGPIDGMAGEGESIRFNNWSIFGSAGAAFGHYATADVVDLRLIEGSCDFNAGGCLKSTAGSFAVSSIGNHYEESSGTFDDFSAPTDLTSIDDEYLIWALSGTDSGIVNDPGGNSQIVMISSDVDCNHTLNYLVNVSGPLLASDQISILWPRWTAGHASGYTNAPNNHYGVTVIDPNDQVIQWGYGTMKIAGNSVSVPGVSGSMTVLGGDGVAVETLPPASDAVGQAYHVSDSTTITTEGETCAGGGTSHALAFSNGVTWKCF